MKGKSWQSAEKRHQTAHDVSVCEVAPPIKGDRGEENILVDIQNEGVGRQVPNDEYLQISSVRDNKEQNCLVPRLCKPRISETARGHRG